MGFINKYLTILYSVSLFLVYQVDKRHTLLQQLMSVKDDEIASYENMNSINTIMTLLVFVFSFIEVAAYFLYLFKVSKLHYNDSHELIKLIILNISVSSLGENSPGPK